MSSDVKRKRAFTLAEAQELLGHIRSITEEAVKETERLSGAIQLLSQSDPTRESAAEELQDVIATWTSTLRSMGLEVKGLWLVDFDNGDGYYCWKYPESVICHYHGYEDGFAGRIKIV